MDLMTASEAASLLRVSNVTISRWIRTGKLKASRLNGQFRIARKDVLAMLTPVEAAKHRTDKQSQQEHEWAQQVLKGWKP